METTTTPAPVALGLDAGGTGTRWALAGADGAVLGEGQAHAVAGAQWATRGGGEALHALLQQLRPVAGRVRAVVAGVSGFDASQAPGLGSLLGHAWRTPEPAAWAMSDIELACHAAQGDCVVYAGTGSVAGFIDAHGVLQRAGGRGAVIDDAGGGHWIARRALRQVWRAEDEQPGAGRDSPLARALSTHIGGSDWGATRAWVLGASRGDLGTLALAVAAAAAEDPAALALLHEAGRELARLPQALWRRHGVRALVLAGRVWDLHPAVEQALRAALPAGTPVRRATLPAHHAAAQLAARWLAGRATGAPA